MKAIKFLFTNELLRDVYAHASKWQVFKFRMRRFAVVTGRYLFILAMAGVCGALGAFFFSSSTVTVAEGETVFIAPSTTPQAIAPILTRIAKCESNSQQFLKSGAVVTNTNTNGTVDVGMYQINLNAANIKTMAKLGFNPFTLEGNTAMAQWIYANEGTSPWNSSMKCWN